jgi:hypothetical protein
MNVKFYVRKSCTESKIIICILKDHANMLRLSTEHTISVNHWDAKSQRAKKTMIGYEQLNDTLDHLKMEVLKQILEYKLHGVTKWPVLKQYLKKYFRPEAVERIDGSDSRSSNHYIVQMFDVFLAARMSEYKPETILSRPEIG